ncbi:pentapeptide repeat-containing protein [Phormidium pseudopriestleyi FRX01]|uniref:Pentapeptide repeat-containing protein n=1 Tax=Phormidium pseudopriestleyi FRX01 TaxID=1759528 RepID=A0ABS3FPC2_9CYAN|nr:pentapeptide repeat-containing protein [Phormidium pseudopriestleyi]MBO0348461.1 pentapeptide repeat-containing protein [Phormidium pseudopriestleyi FRX01]
MNPEPTPNSNNPNPKDNSSSVNPSERGNNPVTPERTRGNMTNATPELQRIPSHSGVNRERVRQPDLLEELDEYQQNLGRKQLSLITLPPLEDNPTSSPGGVLVLMAITIMVFGLAIDNILLGFAGAVGTFTISLRIIWPNWSRIWIQLVPDPWRAVVIAFVGVLTGIIGLLMLSGSNQQPGSRNIQINWEAIGAVGEIVGALGQILIAIIAVYVAWRQYVISKELTIQQNRITQQQTIDTYFQGVSDLALNEEGLLEDWPQERAIAEGRTAAILASVDSEGKSKIIRFLSQSRLLTPLMRDRHLGRPILDGDGGYAEDRVDGVRVIALGVMLAGSDLSGTDLRWTELSEANLVRADLQNCDLVKANLSRAILYEANLSGSDINATRFFYGPVETASPRSRTKRPNYQTGEHTGAVVENANFSKVERMSESQRYYICAWGGSKTRDTVPGGCEGIPNLLGR